MRVVLQRVSDAQVSVSNKVISRIGAGFLVLLGIEEIDTLDDATWLVGKISKMRVFDDSEGKMNLSLKDISGEALVVSQFTLHAGTKKGNRPSFIKAAQPAHAKPLYENFCDSLSTEIDKPVSRGEFGTMMAVSLTNDGPVTILIDSQNRE
ncbi:D-aminoacyl-tRNA deacylase [Akkermansiaceae bacterium]|nr:D-aminoacyl-tRNA deacylase [Akkermansiaceae bacterium]